MAKHTHLNVQVHDDEAVTLDGLRRLILRMHWTDIEALAEFIETERSKDKKSLKRVTGAIVINAVTF